MAVSPRRDRAGAGASTLPALLRGTGRLTRLGLALQVALALALAFGAASLLGWLSAQPGLRQRIDLTRSGENTLAPALTTILDQLPREQGLRIDVFFRALDQPLHELSIEVAERTHRILVLLQRGWPHKVELVNHPLHDRSQEARIHARMVELDVRDPPLLVVSCGPRKAVLHYYGDLAEFDLGNPAGGRGPYVPPRIARFRAEEALTRAILRVTRGEQAQVLFSTGHGEREIYGREEDAMGRLHGALVEDGFAVRWWNPLEHGPVPEDAAVVAIVGPTEAFAERELEWLREFLDRGGRLLLVPPQPTPPGRGNLELLLADYGVKLGSGVVMNPVPGVGGRLTDGVPEVVALTIPGAGMDATHPITAPLRRADRRVRAILSGHLERASGPARAAAAGPSQRVLPPRGAVIESLFASSHLSWADAWRVQGTSAGYDFVWQDQGPGAEPAGPFSLAMAVAFTPPLPGEAAPGTSPERPESRLVVLGSPSMTANVLFDTNRDLLLNAFNWLASREFRVAISSRDPEARRLELGVGRRVAWIQGVAVVGLPLVCLLLGLLTFRIRRR